MVNPMSEARDFPEGEEPARKPRKPPLERPTLEADPQPAPEPEPAGPTPEEALGEVTAQLAERDAELRRVRELAAQANRERDEARTGTATAEARTITAHEASLASAIEAAKSASGRAMEAIRIAREAGDWKAEENALDEHADARARLQSLTVEKRNFDVWKEQQKAAPKPQQQAADQPRPPTAEAQRWIDAHPRLMSDRKFFSVTTAAHNLAILDYEEGSRDYVQFVDDFVRERFPEERPFYQPARRQEQEPAQAPRRIGGPAASSMAPGPSRAGTSSQARANRNMTVGELAQAMGVGADEIASHAKYAGYVDKKTGAVKLDAYLADQTKLYNDRRAGLPTGLLSTGDVTPVR